jgi:hypothetical protein
VMTSAAASNVEGRGEEASGGRAAVDVDET